jgi:hypothetical protein
VVVIDQTDRTGRGRFLFHQWLYSLFSQAGQGPVGGSLQQGQAGDFGYRENGVTVLLEMLNGEKLTAEANVVLNVFGVTKFGNYKILLRISSQLR